MKVCSICGCYNADTAASCHVCGVNFPKARVSAPVPVPPRISSPVPGGVPKASPEKTKYDRMAIAGFVLSLMGICTCITSPLQLAGLVLSSVSAKTKRFKGFCVAGIIISSVALCISLLMWLILILNGEAALTYFSDLYTEYYY